MQTYRFTGLVLGIALFYAMPSFAQKVFSNKEASEEAIISALTPPPPPPPGEATRQIVIKRAEYPMLITFQTNSAELTPGAKQYLDKLGRSLKSDRMTSFSFMIEGHADPRGSDEANLHLSELRAESVVNYLSSVHQIDRSRLKPVGKGKTELLNTDRPDAPENRRVTVRTIVN